MSHVARLASQLVAIRSENPPGNTRDCAEFVRDRLDELGLRTRMAGETSERVNTVANGTNADLLLCGHLDVVPALGETWSFDPFAGEIREGYVLGRGSTDMKGGCAALLAGLEEAVAHGHDLSRIGVAFVCDEETGGDGVRHLLDRGLIAPCDCLIAEPTPESAPCIGQKGLLRALFKFVGEPGHASLYPVRGVSSVMDAVALIEYVRELHERVFDPGPDLARVISDSERVLETALDLPGAGPILRRISFNPGRIDGGEKANIVAEHCDLELDLRLPWGCDPVVLARKLAARAPRATMRCLSSSSPSWTPPGARIVGRISEAIQAVRGAPATPIVQWAASDARALRLAGFPTVEYGPGELARIHAVDERVPVPALEEATAVYLRLIEAYA
ncbi:MAG: M20 family metallopeptidase [Methanospirillum sp.]|nr:M20 family metallopeptidase [Methanospirillum sp.]